MFERDRLAVGSARSLSLSLCPFHPRDGHAWRRQGRGRGCGRAGRCQWLKHAAAPAGRPQHQRPPHALSGAARPARRHGYTHTHETDSETHTRRPLTVCVCVRVGSLWRGLWEAGRPPGGGLQLLRGPAGRRRQHGHGVSPRAHRILYGPRLRRASHRERVKREGEEKGEENGDERGEERASVAHGRRGPWGSQAGLQELRAARVVCDAGQAHTGAAAAAQAGGV